MRSNLTLHRARARNWLRILCTSYTLSLTITRRATINKLVIRAHKWQPEPEIAQGKTPKSAPQQRMSLRAFLDALGAAGVRTVAIKGKTISYLPAILPHEWNRLSPFLLLAGEGTHPLPAFRRAMGLIEPGEYIPQTESGKRQWAAWSKVQTTETMTLDELEALAATLPHPAHRGRTEGREMPLTKAQQYALDRIPIDWFQPYSLHHTIRAPMAMCKRLYEKGYLERRLIDGMREYRKREQTQ